MRKYIASLGGILLTASIFIGITAPINAIAKTSDVVISTRSAYGTPLSVGSLPSAGYVVLDPVNPTELLSLGLGGPSPVKEPPDYPYTKNGMYWSKPFSLVEGDVVQITVYSNSPISWFGVDWSNYDVRGILATTEMDEDGRNFNPQYPISSVLKKVPIGYKLLVNYKILNDTDCVIVMKNSDPEKPQRISMNVSLRLAFSARRILKNIPILKNLVASDRGDTGE